MRVKHVLLKVVIVLLVALAVFFAFRRTAVAPHLPFNPPGAAQAAFLLPLSETTYLPLRNFNLPEPALEAKAAALYDVRSGKTLYAKNLDERLPIASITKLMTALVVLENLPLNANYRVAAEDVNVDGKGADLIPGETLKGGDLLKLMLIKSSNDAALVLSAAARRQGIDLVAKLNDQAQQLAMSNTHFADPAGLQDDEGYSTAGDLIKLARAVGQYPLIWEILATRATDVSSTDGQHRHHLISTDRLLDELPDIIGGKTGYTDGALETMLLEVAVNGGRDRLISVILGSHGRFGETKKLINWGQQAYQW